MRWIGMTTRKGTWKFSFVIKNLPRVKFPIDGSLNKNCLIFVENKLLHPLAVHACFGAFMAPHSRRHPYQLAWMRAGRMYSQGSRKLWKL